MNFSDFNAREKPLTKLKAVCGTLQFQRKVADAQRTAEQFFKLTDNPVVSCGGGKDSTATALIAKSVNSDVKIVCANPPNPLPDRENHNNELRRYLGGTWIDVPYHWDVNSVLRGESKYPSGLKMNMLKKFQLESHIDGVMFGIRSAESKIRAINFRTRGDLYPTKEGWRCTPIVKFTAEEALAIAIWMGAPINPVYEKTYLSPNLEYLHDGTWWCHNPGQYADVVGGWMKYHYPQHYEDYMASVAIQGVKANEVCSY